MRILLVANANIKFNGARTYNIDRKLYHGFVRNGHWVHFFSDRDIARSSSMFGTRKLGKRRCNERLIETFKQFDPEIVVFGHTDVIQPDTIAELRALNPNIPFIQFNVDALFSDSNVAKINSRLPYMDTTYITTAGPALDQFRKENKRVHFMPNVIDSSMETNRCHEQADLPYDLFYAMIHSPKNYDADREEVPFFLKKELPAFNMSYHGFDGVPKIDGTRYYQTIGQCKMGLNLSRKFTHGRHATKDELYMYSSDRIAHYIGNGLLTFVEDGYGMTDLFAEDEIVVFKSRDDLKEKLRYYHEHDKERQKIAKKGWKKAHESFNEKVVSQYLLETTINTTHTQEYPWLTM